MTGIFTVFLREYECKTRNFKAFLKKIALLKLKNISIVQVSIQIVEN